MNASYELSAERPPLHGVRQIVRFNWTFYAGGTMALIAAPLALNSINLPGWLRVLIVAGMGTAGFWLVSSLLVSWLVYDLSGICNWRWINTLLRRPPDRWINLHAGLDESTIFLRQLFPGSQGRVFDIFDEAEMSEPSIHRARRTPTSAEPVDYRNLPLPDESIDAALLLFAAHELRRPDSREKLFRELHRVLKPGGKVIVAEHLRDVANFLSFGPGFLHFHSARQWRRDMAAGRLSIERELSFTPFVRIFVLGRTK